MSKKVCAYCGSEKKVSKLDGKIPLCTKHYTELRRHGDIDPLRSRENLIRYKEDHIEIVFRDGLVGLFDIEDKELVESACWGLDVAGYVHGRVNGRLARYHRHLFKFPEEVVDHKNRNKLDNRKENLRLCTQKDNSRNLSIAKNNTSGVTGVRKTDHGKWNVRITVDRKERHIGNYETLEEAKEARRKAEIKYYGEFAPL